MGKERDRLIRRLGGIPLSDRDLSDEELMRRRMEYYAREGRLPPEIVAIRRKTAGERDAVLPEESEVVPPAAGDDTSPPDEQAPPGDKRAREKGN